MTAVIYMVKGDRRPSILATLKRKDQTVDLTNASKVEFHMKKGDTVLIDAEANIVDAAGGKVRYDWKEGETNVLGVCKAEFKVIWSDGTEETFPNKDGDFLIVFRGRYEV